MSDLIVTENFKVIHCGGCGISYAVTNTFYQDRNRDHKTFYCPNGCSRYYPQESDIDKAKRLAREAQEKANRLQACIDNKKSLIQHQLYQIRHYKGEVTKLKNKKGGNK